MLNNKRQKIIILACPQGRIGSSMVMGLLKISGVYVGDENKLTRPAAINPKGFFELMAHNQLLDEIFPKEPGLFAPPSYAELERLRDEHSKRYFAWFEQEFGQQSPIAIKSPQLLSIPFFIDTSRPYYDVRIVLLRRDFVHQAKSLRRVWKNNDARKDFTVDEIVAWLVKWRNFSLQLLNHYHLEYLDLSFEDFLIAPLVISTTMLDFLEIPKPSNEQILDWVDPELVNRKRLPQQAFLQKIRKRLRFIYR